MKRSTLNFITDLVSLIILLTLVISGFIIKYVLPPGSGGRGRVQHDGRGQEHIKTLWSIGRHEWGDIHFYLAVLFVVLMAVHIFLHWRWIRNYLRTLFGSSQNEC